MQIVIFFLERQFHKLKKKFINCNEIELLIESKCSQLCYKIMMDVWSLNKLFKVNFFLCYKIMNTLIYTILYFLLFYMVIWLFMLFALWINGLKLIVFFWNTWLNYLLQHGLSKWIYSYWWWWWWFVNFRICSSQW